MSKKPGENTGKDGGIYQEVAPRGGKKDIAKRHYFDNN